VHGCARSFGFLMSVMRWHVSHVRVHGHEGLAAQTMQHRSSRRDQVGGLWVANGGGGEVVHIHASCQ
jgi:hypothetical protein